MMMMRDLTPDTIFGRYVVTLPPRSRSTHLRSMKLPHGLNSTPANERIAIEETRFMCRVHVKYAS